GGRVDAAAHIVPLNYDGPVEARRLFGSIEDESCLEGSADGPRRLPPSIRSALSAHAIGAGRAFDEPLLAHVAGGPQVEIADQDKRIGRDGSLQARAHHGYDELAPRSERVQGGLLRMLARRSVP